LTGNDSIIGLSFSVPIGQRAARARESIAAAGVRELEFESVVLTDQLRRDVALSLEALDYGRLILAISREQEAVAEQLQRQEQERFEAGVSDLFLLINRETAALQAHLKSVDAEVDLMRQELALQATLAQLLPSA
jgi:Outer membrane protein